MFRFRDAFTGTIWEIGPEWHKKVTQVVAQHLKKCLGEDLKSSADRAARFWRDTYYKWLFPLRFGLRETEGLFSYADFFPGAQSVNLEALTGRELRCRFLDGENLPPLLPEATEGTELLADRLLSQAALANVLLRQAGASPDVLHATRLAILTYPLLDYLEEDLRHWPRALEFARFLNHRSEEGPDGILGEILGAIRKGTALDTGRVWLVLAAVQRVKRYVFETPGLNEIRGASTLLDDWTEEGAEAVSQEIGPETVLQAVASTLLFLAPAEKDERGERWDARLRRMLYEKTGTAFAAVGLVEIPAKVLMENYLEAMSAVHKALERDRAQAKLPIMEALPFETRCHLCRTRPAEGWTMLPGEAEPVPLCRACETKRAIGLQERSAKLIEVMKWIGKDFSSLGLPSTDWMARAIGTVSEGGFIPDDARRPLLATIYGDGNNFGAVVSKLQSMPMALQWTQRVKWTTRAAVAIALARATQETAMDRGWKPGEAPILKRLPFQVLVMGGDDLILLAWAPAGVRFAQYFLQMIDLEFQQGAEPRLTGQQPITFSLGMLIADHKAPVRRTVEFTEKALLKWAKRAFQERQSGQGTVAMLLALTPEQIPANLEAYCQQMYMRCGEFFDLCLTLRPFTAEELGFLLEKARQLRDGGYTGPMHRLVSAMVTGDPLAGILYYIYQRARLEGRTDDWLAKLEAGPVPSSLAGLRYPVNEFPGRHPLGMTPKKRKTTYFSPLWDLMELVKVLE